MIEEPRQALSTSSRKATNLALVPIAMGFMALGAIVAMTLWLNEQARGNFDAVVQARGLGTAAVGLRSALQAAESSQRGFLYAHNEIYLAPYDVSRTQARQQLKIVNEGLEEYPNLLQARDRLTKILDAKFIEMDQSIDLRRNRKDAEALTLIQKNRGKAMMDEANVYIGGMIRAADERLLAGVNEQRANASLLRWVSIVGALVILGVVAVIAKMVRTYTQNLATADSEVREINASLERRVEQRTSELARVNDEIQKFAHIVTHDLRAPLVNIMGFGAELESGIKQFQHLVASVDTDQVPTQKALDEIRNAAVLDMPEALQFIRSSTKKMDGLIGAILRLARDGRRTLFLEEIDPGAAVEAAASAIRHQLAADGGKFSLEVRVPTIRTDRFSFEAIIGNLLDNAAKYRSEDRPLEISVKIASDMGGKVKIDVRDNGRGISQKDLERIFEPFRRAGPQDQKGEGIGLAYVRTLLQNLRGHIEVASELNKGSIFSFTLPMNAQIERT